jgi:rfaE bifunctional protein kinase chain/domain
MLDRYWMGTVDRISPEAPVPVLLLQQEDIRLGGAANVALNLKALGVRPFLLSITGNDPAAQQLCKQLNNEDIDSKYILFSPIRKTTVKTRMMAKNHQILRLDEELTTPLTATDEQVLLKNLAKIMASEHT